MRLKNVAKGDRAVLEELEGHTGKKFKEVAEYKLDTEMGFTVENQRVTGLGLYQCGVSTLPESIGHLSSLKTLWLQSNKLSTLPESITNLKSLEKLYLSRNDLKTLPESITKLQSLKTLSLGYNEFTTLPESIGHLSSLKTLWLQRNDLSTLPESITNLKLFLTSKSFREAIKLFLTSNIEETRKFLYFI